MKILIVTDAWEPQVNGVVRTLKMTTHELGLLGHEVHIVSPQGWPSVPCPTYPDIRLAAVTPAPKLAVPDVEIHPVDDRRGVVALEDVFQADCTH